MHFGDGQGHQGQNSPLLECWKFHFPSPTTTPHSQAHFLLPPITGMSKGVHVHRSAWRLVTQEIRNVSPEMTAGRRQGGRICPVCSVR